jgi:hypothetical protein
VGNGDGLVGLALLTNPLRPDAVRKGRPVVFAGLELFPAFLQVFPPLGQAGNRFTSPVSSVNQRRSRDLLECGFHQPCKEMKGVLALELAGSGHGENPLGEALSAIWLVAKAELSPLNSRP